MPYTALPDMRIPYDDDGTVVGQGVNGFVYGISAFSSQAVLIEWQNADTVAAGIYAGVPMIGALPLVTWWFFPEQREVTGYFAVGDVLGGPAHAWYGSNDSTNGLDGTWETASLPGGGATFVTAYSWRSDIKPISFTGPKRVVRWYINAYGYVLIIHLYGEKAAGQTPDDIIYIDHDTTPGAEYTAAEDFGDRPLGTTVTRQFRVKNTSATKTANTINIQINDADFIISTDNTTWVVTINIGSLGPGAESATMYVRNTTPGAGNLLGPRFSRIVTTVGSWT